ncbi:MULTISPECIES: hypothetical protein [unclassified Pseudomonas]|uniref:hypothetical protein n=1 Tax=unclassified Pseudomonas TaxID=196821 RepID=UPI00244A584E|nr:MULTISPECIES: hypothetical protein [unclassified Pseudomonas]MDH0302293.1 hypothetical protein [Pseudomonas sp. GD04091]MDH1984735.1 hypothetical protein [Pseudomonas sp. GD03689]
MNDQEVACVQFTPSQAQALADASQALAELGGPQARGAARQAHAHAERLTAGLTLAQQSTLRRFAQGNLSVLLFSQMQAPNDPPPERLPALAALEQDADCLYLASRNQLLLELAHYRAFAFDIDNDGKLVRLVANFKGGGHTPCTGENRLAPVELSSHSGLHLGPHTEAPYNCSVQACHGHSPAPSALILTARWNPAREPTRVFPLPPIIEQLGGLHALALTSPSFDFSRSECFVQGQGAAGKATSMLQFDPNGGFSMRYNAYRFSVNDDASEAAARAFDAFQNLLGSARPMAFVLDAGNALLINNCRALHGRDTVQDNRRLLVRLFAYSPFARPLVISDDPLLVRG